MGADLIHPIDNNDGWAVLIPTVSAPRHCINLALHPNAPPQPTEMGPFYHPNCCG